MLTGLFHIACSSWLAQPASLIALRTITSLASLPIVSWGTSWEEFVEWVRGGYDQGTLYTCMENFKDWEEKSPKTKTKTNKKKNIKTYSRPRNTWRSWDFADVYTRAKFLGPSVEWHRTLQKARLIKGSAHPCRTTEGTGLALSDQVKSPCPQLSGTFLHQLRN